MNRLSKIIGLTIGPKSLLLAEVAAKAGSSAAIQKLAEFAYPEGQSLGTPEPLGVSLAAFLRAQGFSVKDVIIGLPAKRLLTRRKEVPPASEAIVASTLRLQAETEFAGEADPYAIDYAGETSTSSASAVMLVATAQNVVDQCNALAKSAGLKLRGITATSAALGRATSKLPGGDGLVVTLASGGAELVVQHGTSTSQLRHLAVTNAGSVESMNSLVGEIRRAVASLHQNGTPMTLALWDDAAGESGAAGSLLRERLGMPVSEQELRSIASSATAGKNAFAPAVAVALSALDAAGPPVDFLHSRLAPPKQHSNKRPILIGSIVGAVIVLAIIAGWVDLSMKQSVVDALVTEHNKHLPEIKVAQTGDDRLKFANKWTQHKRVYDACLLDITKLCPDEGTIWVTSLTLVPPPTKSSIAGKALSEPQVRELKDKMLASKMFINPEIKDNRKSPVSGKPGTFEQSFTIEFIYKPAEKP